MDCNTKSSWHHFVFGSYLSKYISKLSDSSWRRSWRHFATIHLKITESKSDCNLLKISKFSASNLSPVFSWQYFVFGPYLPKYISKYGHSSLEISSRHLSTNHVKTTWSKSDSNLMKMSRFSASKLCTWFCSHLILTITYLKIQPLDHSEIL